MWIAQAPFWKGGGSSIVCTQSNDCCFSFEIRIQPVARVTVLLSIITALSFRAAQNWSSWGKRNQLPRPQAARLQLLQRPEKRPTPPIS